MKRSLPLLDGNRTPFHPDPMVGQMNRRLDPPAEVSSFVADPWIDTLEDDSEPWRQYGRARRQSLLDNDKAATSFRMNAACSIQKYFSLAKRVCLCGVVCDIDRFQTSNAEFIFHELSYR